MPYLSQNFEKNEIEIEPVSDSDYEDIVLAQIRIDSENSELRK